MTRAGSALVAVLLTACLAGQGQPAEPQRGPTFVTQVTNRSAEEVAIAYEFQSEQFGGGGEGLSPSCTRIGHSWGSVAGHYAVSVDGVTVFEGEAPRGMPPDGFFVIRIEVDPDGRATVAGPSAFTRLAPDLDPRPIACG